MRAGSLVALSILVASQAAHAETKAWTTAKKNLPADQQMVVVANFAQIRDSQLFQTVWPKFLASHKEAADMLGKTKATCGFDAVGSIDTVVMALKNVDSGDDPTFVVTLKGITQKDVDSCLGKLQAAQSGKKVTITTADGVTTYDMGAGDTTLYMRWTDKSTFVFNPAGKDSLVKNTKGGITGDKALAPAMGSLKSNAAIVLATTKSLPLDQVAPGATSKLVFMSANVTSGNLSAEVHLVVDSAKTATDFAAKMSSQLADAKKSGQIPPMFSSLVNSIAVKATGADVVISASAPEKDILPLLALAMP